MRSITTVLGLFLSITLHADGGIWGARGIPKELVVLGERLYAADGRGVASYDIRDVRRIHRIDVESRGDETLSLAVAGSSDLVAGTRRGIEHYSVQPDGSLSFVRAFSSSQPVRAVAATDDEVAIASGETVVLYSLLSGQLELDRTLTFEDNVVTIAYVSDHLYVSVERKATYIVAPGASQHSALLSYVPRDLALSGTILWGVAGLDGLRAMDVSNPISPVTLGISGQGQLRLDGVAANGDRVAAFMEPDRVVLFDASDPEEPRLASTIQEWADVIALSDRELFFSGAIVDDEELTRANGVIHVYDFANIDAPFHVGLIGDHAGPVSGVWTDGSIAYVVDAPYLRVLDVSRTSEPREIGSLFMPDIQDRIRVKNGRAVIYGRAHVNVVDLSVPHRPRLIGTWDAQGHPRSSAALTTGTRFVEGNEHSGFHVVDYPTAATAGLVGHRIWHYHDVAAADDVVYLLQVGGSVLALELLGGTTVADRGTTAADAEHFDIAPPSPSVPKYLVLAEPHAVRLMSLADRFRPVTARRIVTSTLPGPIGTSDTFAMIEVDGSLLRLNFEGSGPLEDSGLRTTSAMQISVAGDKIVVADRYFVRVFGPDTPAPDIPASRRRSVR
jgi:hypothetical protein